MNVKRAIWMSVLAYIASLLIGIIVTVAFGIDMGETQEIPAVLWYAGAFTSVVFGGGFAYWYFRSSDACSCR